MLRSSFLNKKYKYILAIIFAVALIVRWWFLPQNAVSFAYDQGRDAFIARQIAMGDLKIQGPSSSTPGLFHGVLYFYVITIPYILGHGSPIVAAAFLSLISALGVFTVFWLTKIVTKQILPSIFAAVIFAVSFEAVQYSNFLSNASIGMWFVPFIYIGLFLWVSGKRKTGPVLTALGLGLATQSLITLFYHIVPIVFWLLIFKKKLDKRSLLLFLVIFFISISTMVITQLRLGLGSLDGIVFLLTGKDKITHDRTLISFIYAYVGQLSTSLARTIFPLNYLFGSIAGWVVIGYSIYKNKLIKNGLPSWQFFLASYVLSHIFALAFGGINMRHILVGVSAGISCLSGIFIWNYLKSRKLLMYIALSLIVLSNLTKVYQTGPSGQSIFPLQPDLVLSKEIKLIDFTYKEASGGPFSVSTLTSPLFVNSTWSYLYNWYGDSKYGYLPYYRGRDQVGQLGNNLVNNKNKDIMHFFILEPTYGIPEEYVRYAIGEQQSFSIITKQISYGELVVQKREILK